VSFKVILDSRKFHTAVGREIKILMCRSRLDYDGKVDIRPTTTTTTIKPTKEQQTKTKY